VCGECARTRTLPRTSAPAHTVTVASAASPRARASRRDSDGRNRASDFRLATYPFNRPAGPAQAAARPGPGPPAGRAPPEVPRPWFRP
jgi:hypothetical protein